MKRSYFRVMSRLFGVPLLIEPGRFQIAVSSLASRFALDPSRFEVDGVEVPAAAFLDFGEDDGAEEEAEPVAPYQLLDGVAVIPVIGELVQRSSWMDSASGLVSYETISAALSQALVDPGVKSILLHVDSPGGEVAGCFELGDEIFAARGVKQIVAVSDDCACSGAYALASAASKFYVPQAGAIGNVGVIVSHVDTSAADAKRGVKITRFYGGARKGDYWEPLNEESSAALKARVEDLHAIFASAVARNRGLKTEAVYATEASFYVGAKAVELGLADGVKPFSKVLSEMQQAAAALPSRLRGLPTLTPSTGAPTPFASAPELPADGGATDDEEQPMAKIDTKTLTPEAIAAMADENEQLKAEKTALELDRKNELARKRETCFEKHAKRLSPATMASMRQSLGGVDDPEKVDGILSKIRDEINPLAPAPAAVSPADAPKSEDAEQELIDRAKAKVKETSSSVSPLNLQDAMLAVIKEDPKLKQRVHEQRAAYFSSRSSSSST